MPLTNSIALSIIVPVFNEEGNLLTLYQRLITTLKKLGKSYEIFFIDDGSSDNSLQILTDIQQQDAHVTVIQLACNFGQHPAIVAGLHRVKGEAVVLMDADLQNPPEEIIPLYEKFLEGFDVVYGIREQREDLSWRLFGSEFVVWLIEKLLGIEVPIDIMSGFRIIHQKVVKTLNNIKEQQYDTSVMMLWLGFSHAGVVVKHDNRYLGESKYNIRKLLYLTLDIFIGFSDFPLRAASILGSFLIL